MYIYIYIQHLPANSHMCSCMRRYAAEGTCGAIISGARQIRIEGSGSQVRMIACMSTHACMCLHACAHIAFM